MPMIDSAIPNLINGVSQQSPSLRLATQCDEQINGYSTVVEGLKKRPPRVYLGKINRTYPDSAFVHTMNRDASERYQLFISDGDLRVYDIQTGEEKVVNFPDGKAYLAGADPKTQFSAVTVADYTFITNKTVATQLNPADIEPHRIPEALVWVKAGNYGKSYALGVHGFEAGTHAYYRTGDGVGTNPENDVTTVDTANIARRLINGSFKEGGDRSTTDNPVTNLATHLQATAGWGLGLYGSVIHITYAHGAINLKSDDGFGGNAMTVIEGTVQTFTELPKEGPNGIVVKVQGDEGNDTDHYYVKFNSTSKTWTECPGPGTVCGFDASTMPHILVSEADGTFTFKRAEWDRRVSGDVVVIPPPSFVGRSINAVTFHKNRLIFVSDENVVMSRAGDFFNFWRASALSLLDDDPIDTGVSHDKVSIINHAIPWLNDLFLFSDQTQFSLTADAILTPKSVTIDPTTEFESSSMAKPVSVGRYIYFVADRGSWSAIHEYFLMDEFSGTYDTNDTTSHVPAYIPGKVFKLSASSAESCLIALSEMDRRTIYVYRYYWSNNEKLQSCWSKWTVEEGSAILNAELFGSILFLTVRYADGTVAFERIPMDPGYTDDGSEYVTLIDRRITEELLTGGTYDPVTRTTTFTLPYEATAMEAYTRDAPGVAGGMTIPVISVTGDEIVLSGDRRNTPMYLGVPYELRYRFSEFFIRKEAVGGGVTIETEGRLQLKYLSVVYDDTSSFRIEVTPRGRKTYRYLFNGRVAGDVTNVAGKLARRSGTFKVPVMSNSKGTIIEIVNDTAFPSNFLSASWTARYVTKSRSV